MMQSTRDRDYGQQEIAHMLNGLPLVKSDFQEITLDLGSMRDVDLEAVVDRAADDAASVTRRTLVDFYRDRGKELHDMCLLEYAHRFETRKVNNHMQVQERAQQQSKPSYVFFYPYRANRSPKDLPPSQRAEWFRWQLMLMRPWREQVKNAFDGCDDSIPNKNTEVIWNGFVGFACLLA